MKIYTLDYDFNRPIQKTITIPTNTEYKIGVSAKKNGQILDLTEGDVQIQIGENTLPTSGIYNGYVTFDYAQGRTPATEMAKVKVTFGDDTDYTFDLMIVGKFGTKGDIADGSGSGEGVKVVKIVDGKIEGYDTYASLLRDAQNGRIRLQHYVTGDISKPVLYTTHLCDDTAIRFDATGTLGSKVYTKSIAVTPSGTGYVVSIGNLTELGSKTALFEGEYEDGSTFSMNVFIK